MTIKKLTLMGIVESDSDSYFSYPLSAAIFNILENFSQKQPLTVRVIGLAGSAASVILLAGNDRQIETGATVFIHEPLSVGNTGNRHALREEANTLDSLTENAK